MPSHALNQEKERERASSMVQCVRKREEGGIRNLHINLPFLLPEIDFRPPYPLEKSLALSLFLLFSPLCVYIGILYVHTFLGHARYCLPVETQLARLLPKLAWEGVLGGTVR